MYGLPVKARTICQRTPSDGLPSFWNGDPFRFPKSPFPFNSNESRSNPSVQDPSSFSAPHSVPAGSVSFWSMTATGHSDLQAPPTIAVEPLTGCTCPSPDRNPSLPPFRDRSGKLCNAGDLWPRGVVVSAFASQTRDAGFNSWPGSLP